MGDCLFDSFVEQGGKMEEGSNPQSNRDAELLLDDLLGDEEKRKTGDLLSSDQSSLSSEKLQ
jgi:hypothetical protein